MKLAWLVVCVALVCCKPPQDKEELEKKAEQLDTAAKDAISYVHYLKKKLEAQDSTGINASLVEQLMIGTPISDTLSHKLVTVHDLAYATLIDKNKTRSLDSTMHVIKEIKSNKQWSSKWFQGTPTIAASTILTKLEYDCQDATRLVLGDIETQLAN